MARNTELHGFPVPERGDSDYADTFVNYFDDTDEAIEIRDTAANIGDYEAVSGAKFLATDTGAEYIGDGTNWNLSDKSVAQTYVKALADAGYVGTNDGEYTTIQAAIDNHSAAVITESYDPANETWPVTLDSTSYLGKLITSENIGEISIDTGGNGAFKIDISNSRQAGVMLRDLSIVDTAAGSTTPTIQVLSTSYTVLDNVSVDHNNNGSVDAFYMADNGATPNSNTFRNCVAEQVGGVGFHILSGSHSTTLRDCRVMVAGAEGIYLDGLSHQVDISGGQVQEADKAGIRVTTASNIHIESLYFEGNGNNTTGGAQTDYQFSNGADNITIENCWHHGTSGETPRLLNQNTAGTVEARHLRWNDEYNNIFDLNDGVFITDKETLKAAGTGSPNVWLVDAAMGRIIDNGTIVGAGSNNGGNDDAETGIDLSVVIPDRVGERAISDGTSTGTAGLLAVSVPDTNANGNPDWQPSDGSAVITT